MGSVAGANNKVNVCEFQIVSHFFKDRAAIFSSTEDSVISVWNFRIELNDSVNVTLILRGTIELICLSQDLLQEVNCCLRAESAEDSTRLLVLLVLHDV